MLLIDGDLIVYRLAWGIEASLKSERPISEYGIRSLVRGYVKNLLTIKPMVAVNSHIAARIYLTASGAINMRHKLATIIPYKASRRLKARPIAYDFIRDCIKKDFTSLVRETTSVEADDIIAIVAGMHNYEPTILSYDKDLLTIPGWHYNFNTNEYKFVTPAEAKVYFYGQMVTGDRADDVPSLFQLVQHYHGDKVANKYKKTAYKKRLLEQLTPDLTEQEMYAIIYKEAEEWKIPESALIEVGRLLWLGYNDLEDDEYLWQPPTLLEQQCPQS